MMLPKLQGGVSDMHRGLTRAGKRVVLGLKGLA